MSFVETHLSEVCEIARRIDAGAVEKMVDLLAGVRRGGGRLFLLGVGGSAGSCSHAVNDFRKLVGIEAYTPSDNVSELTARTNDEGWGSVFVEWLRTSHIGNKDAVFVLSVGGGSLEKNISPNIVTALQLAKDVGAKVIGIVGRDGGYTARVADACVLVPTVNAESITPHTESFHAVIWHLFYLGKYFHRAERLHDVFICTDLFAAFLLSYLPFSGQHDHIGVLQDWITLDGAADIITVDLRHHDVKKQDVRAEFPDLRDRFSAILRKPQLISLVFEEVGESLSDVFVIISYKYFFLFHGCEVTHIL